MSCVTGLVINTCVVCTCREREEARRAAEEAARVQREKHYEEMATRMENEKKRIMQEQHEQRSAFVAFL